MRETTYIEGFRSMVRRYPERTALRTLDGRVLTYRDLDERTDALAVALEERLGDGRCAAVMENRVAAVESMLAAMKRGRANVQLFTRSAPGELVSMAETGEARGLLFDAATADRAAEVAERRDFDAVVGVGDAADAVDAAASYEDLVAGADPEAAADLPDAPDESAVFFTSGTTSTPKAVLVDGEQSWLAANQPALEMSLTASDRALVCTPWYHQVTANTWILGHLLVGGTLVLQRSFDPATTLRALADHEITGLLAVPTQLEAMLEAQEEVGADLGALSYIRTGGAIVPEDLIDRTKAAFTEGVFNTYGLTEGMINLAFAYPEDQRDHPGTIGKGSFLWELRVVETAEPPATPDPEAEVDAGESGEILARGPRMIDGYLNPPPEVDSPFVDGWLRTGDVARVDEEGYLVVTDRVDNMISSGGENVYPKEVERALRDHPGVRDAGVVGLPDDRWGEVVAAVVVVEAGVTEEDLDAHCRAHDTLADFKRPRKYALRDDDEGIPRTATGTLQQDAVADLFE